MFTSGGTQYYHLFNITLCGLHSQSVCLDNITTVAGDAEPSGVRALICRSTIIPDEDGQVFATQSVSLGEQLLAITTNVTFDNVTVHEQFRGVRSDLHLFFATGGATVACRQGRRLTITIRCAPQLETTWRLSAPKACPDGTCDGCVFHLLIETKTAAVSELNSVTLSVSSDF